MNTDPTVRDLTEAMVLANTDDVPYTEVILGPGWRDKKLDDDPIHGEYLRGYRIVWAPPSAAEFEVWLRTDDAYGPQTKKVEVNAQRFRVLLDVISKYGVIEGVSCNVYLGFTSACVAFEDLPSSLRNEVMVLMGRMAHEPIEWNGFEVRANRGGQVDFWKHRDESWERPEGVDHNTPAYCAEYGPIGQLAKLLGVRIDTEEVEKKCAEAEKALELNRDLLEVYESLNQEVKIKKDGQ